MTTSTQYTHVELLTLHGPVFRRVSTAPPRLPTENEIPIIDLSTIDDGLEARKAVATQVRAAAENTGFFYIKNHGIPEELIQRALAVAQTFFNQTDEQKQLVSHEKSGYADGYHGVGSTQINKTETRGVPCLQPSNIKITPVSSSDPIPIQIAKRPSRSATTQQTTPQSPSQQPSSPTSSTPSAAMTSSGKAQRTYQAFAQRQSNFGSVASPSPAR